MENKLEEFFQNTEENRKKIMWENMMAVENRNLRHDLETIDSEAENRTNGAEYFTMK